MLTHLSDSSDTNISLTMLILYLGQPDRFKNVPHVICREGTWYYTIQVCEFNPAVCANALHMNGNEPVLFW